MFCKMLWVPGGGPFILNEYRTETLKFLIKPYIYSVKAWHSLYFCQKLKCSFGSICCLKLSFDSTAVDDIVFQSAPRVGVQNEVTMGVFNNFIYKVS